MQDFRVALRQFWKAPQFSATAILSLALGIGATTGIFSVIYGILLNPYPYKDSDRMVHIELSDPSNPGNRGALLQVNGAEYQQLRQAPSLDDVFLMNTQSVTLTGSEFPITVAAGHYTSNMFTFMGVNPQLGREFTPADVTDGQPTPVAVLSYRFWQKQFAGNPDVIGQNIELDHKLYTAIGVVPPRFTWGDSDVYLPAAAPSDPHELWAAFVKLKPGRQREAAASELQVLVDRFTQDNAEDSRRGRRLALITLNQEVLGHFSGTLILLFIAVLTLLIIGCSNLSILLLARGTARQHELAVRTSIGASRGRLMRQLLIESMLLSLAGSALGVLAAYRSVGLISSMLPLYAFPHEAVIRVNAPVLLFSAAMALISGILFGISPAWQLSRPEISQLIQASSSRHSGNVQARNTHRMLIASQIALTLLLMTGAGAAIRSFLSLLHTPLGFAPDHLVTMNVTFPRGTNPTWEARFNAQEAVRQAVEQTPGVASASISNWFPPFGAFTAPIGIRSEPTLTDAQAMLATASPQEFATLRIPLLAGRIFTAAETNGAARVALVNEAFVKQFLQNQQPIGQSVRSPVLNGRIPNLFMAPGADGWLEVIGVVADARDDGLDHPVKPAVFIPYSFVLPPDVSMMARTTGDPDAVIRSIQQHLHQLNSEIVVTESHTLLWSLETLREGWGQGRFLATLFSLFALLALLLAATGLYSVVTFAVSQRTQEVGIRIALGAPRMSILQLVVLSTAIPLGIGVLAGIALSTALSHAVTSWSGVNPGSPLTLLGAALLLVVVAMIACVLPAWRAATMKPMAALRYE